MSAPDLKRRDIFGFLLVVVAGGLLIGLLSNAMFAALYPMGPARFTLVVVVLLTLVLLLAFVLAVLPSESRILEISFPTVMDRRAERFLDLPFSPVSVNLRVFFDRAEPLERNALVLEARSRVAWNGKLHQFVDDGIQAAILLYLFGTDQGKESTSSAAFAIRDLPEGISGNPILVELQNRFPEFRLLIPRWVRLETLSDPATMSSGQVTTLAGRGRLIRLSSKFGDCEIIWGSGIVVGALHVTRGFLSAEVESQSCIEFDATAELRVTTRHRYAFARGYERHLQWIRRMEHRFRGLDWAYTQDPRTQELLAVLLGRSRGA